MICLNRVTHTNALLSILGSSGPKKRPDTHKVDISTKKLKELNQIRYEGFIWILPTRVDVKEQYGLYTSYQQQNLGKKLTENSLKC